MPDDLIEDVKEFAEDIFSPEDFQPRPGGLIDRHRKERARRAEAAQEQENIDSRVEGESYKAVKVAQQSPEIFAPYVVTIGPGDVANILVLSKYRSRATILVTTTASTVVLCKDQGAAISANGFPLATAIPFPVNGRGQLWGYNPGESTIQIGVLAELYAPEK